MKKVLFCRNLRVFLMCIIVILSFSFIMGNSACTHEAVEVVSSELTVETVRDMFGASTRYYRPYLTVVVRNNTSNNVSVYVAAQFTYPNGRVYEGSARFGYGMKPKSETKFLVEGPEISSSSYGFRASDPILKVKVND